MSLSYHIIGLNVEYLLSPIQVHTVLTSAANRSIGSTTGCTIMEKAPTKTLLRHYAELALTPRSLNVKLGPRRKGHKGRAV